MNNEKFNRWLIGKSFHQIYSSERNSNYQTPSSIDGFDVVTSIYKSSSIDSKDTTMTSVSSIKSNDSEQKKWIKCLTNQRNYSISLFDFYDVPTLEVAKRFYQKFKNNQAKLFNVQRGERKDQEGDSKKSKVEISKRLTRREWRSQVKTMFDNLMVEARLSDVPSEKRRTKFKNRCNSLHLETEKAIKQLHGTQQKK